MPDYLSISYRDESREVANERLRVTDVTAANFDAQVTARAALVTASNVLTLGVLAKSMTEIDVVKDSAVPADVNAQRERKWLIYYTDDVTGKEYQTELPTADLENGHKIAFQDNADLTNADWTAYIAAFEAVVTAPDTGNAVTVRRAKHVGRNT